MHYYKFNIADWNLSTSHLSLQEEAVYFRLVNYYYDTEKPIPKETQSVIRRLRLGSDTDIVELILDEFFELTDKGWVHCRCEKILKEYRKTAKKNKENGAKGGRPSKHAASSITHEKPSGFPDESQKNPNYKPITNNHKPITTTKGKEKPKRFVPPSVEEVRDYVFEKGYSFDPESFVAYYDSNGWKVGKNRMKNWKACCVTWNNRDKSNGNAKGKHDITFDDINDTDWIKNVDPAVYSRTGGNG
jgi:uncharacterized protein YdaU (DUF1376 family)